MTRDTAGIAIQAARCFDKLPTPNRRAQSAVQRSGRLAPNQSPESVRLGITWPEADKLLAAPHGTIQVSLIAPRRARMQ